MEDGQGPNKSLRLSTASSIHGQSNYLSLKDLEDDLLIEILSRIRSTRSACQCKLVCKRWCSLMSTPYFVGRIRFIANQRMIAHDDDINSSDQSFGILVTCLHRARRNRTVSVARQNPNHGPSNLAAFNLDNYLPLYWKDRSILVLASCNDLILCQSVPNRKEYWNYCFGFPYYLCNPFTKQWVALQPPYRARETGFDCTRFGLICELAADNYSIYRYRVVRFYSKEHFRSATRFEVKTYHSETCQWVQSDQLLGGKYRFGSEIVAYNGKLHWVNTEGTCLNTYDPFNTEQEQISSVDGPYLNSVRDDQKVKYYKFHVGECDGVLRIMGIEICRVGSNNLKVWDLQTDQDGRRTWSLKHNVSTKTMFSNRKEMARKHKFALGLGLKKNVVFLKSGDLLVSYNFQSGEFKVEGQVWRDVGRGGCLADWYSVFLLQLPWWPTPIPKPSKAQPVVCIDIVDRNLFPHN